MSEFQWTEDQKKIIEKHGCNLLVSAAAGSGKTAVLVERIFNRVADRENPVQIDQFVVVTFTKAAAAQMKDRLRERIESALEENPDQPHLQRQIGLLPAAHISTVHSFCGYVIQNYFHRIGFDPAYRQGTNSELALMQKEVLKELLEDAYERGEEPFNDLASMNMFNRSDSALEDMILELYNKAMSEPFPREWLGQLEKSLFLNTREEWEASAFCRNLLSECRHVIQGIREEAEELLRLCEEPSGPYMYAGNVEEVIEICDGLSGASDYEEYRKGLSEVTLGRMSAKKDETVSPDMREFVKERRNACKERIKKLSEDFFAQSIEEHLADLAAMRGKLSTLIALALEFHSRYTERKRERGVVDFNDLEQLSLEILLEWDEEQNGYRRTSAAEELSEYFEEIMIDEYQDSNRVQETILSAVAKQREGVPCNLFLVGDVKQSIYRFRNACPELFVEKMKTYGQDGSAGERIDLHQNFRSRNAVLMGSNAVFERVMREDIGGVEYDEDARLRTGREFEETDKRTGGKIEVCVLLNNKDMEYEARLAVEKIRDMMNPEHPLYVEEKGLRPVDYRDIVILVRSVKGMGQRIFDVLTEAGMPVVMERTQGFYDTREITLMSQMLQIIDNPRNDIPLAGVLCSPMFDVTEEELAAIRASHRDGPLYESLEKYRGEWEEEKGDSPLQKKLRFFFDTLETMRGKTTYATVAQLIQDIYDATGIYEAVQMMRDGAQRTANMDSLMEQAREFDGTAYHGLHQFVRYIHRIREQQEEIGEVNIAGEEENVIRIMTIHKSKGLEFPICLILGMGKKLGGRDSGFLTIHPQLGVASKIVDNERRTVKDTLYRRLVKQQNEKEDLGEELRVLYVAMTRAKEKLILIGSAREVQAGALSYLSRRKMDNYLDMALPAVFGEPEWFNLSTTEPEGLLNQAVCEQVWERAEAELFNNFDTSVLYHRELRDILEQIPETETVEQEPLPVKVSVSDLKVKSMEEMELRDFTVLNHEEEDEEMPVPSFVQEAKEDAGKYRGAAYGTIWHQVMATIDFSHTDCVDDIEEEITRLIQSGRLREDERPVLNSRRLYQFFESPLGREMKKAYCGGQLYREQPFVMAKPACEIFPDRTESEPVLIQGIIDGYYVTGDEVILMDYKTDSLKPGEEGKLVRRYYTQMALYKKALEDMLHKPVADCVLYSFSLGKEISCREVCGDV